MRTGWINARLGWPVIPSGAVQVVREALLGYSLMNSKLKESERKCQNRSAFTLIELLVVITTIAVLATMLLPAVAGTKPDGQTLQCLNNHRRLVLAWSMYAADNNDRLAINSDPAAGGFFFNGKPSWIRGIEDWGTSLYGTNVVFLIDDRYSLLGGYLNRSPEVFHCPADIFVSPPQRSLGWTHRARSAAMNGAIGDGNKYQSFPFSSTYWWAKKSSDLILPGPSASWVFTDEHPDSIDDGIMYVYSGYTNGAGQFTELPASYHNGACGMSFADGHAIMHKWQSPATVRPVTYTYMHRLDVSNDPDLAWLAQHTPRKN